MRYAGPKTFSLKIAFTIESVLSERIGTQLICNALLHSFSFNKTRKLFPIFSFNLSMKETLLILYIDATEGKNQRLVNFCGEASHD